MRKLLTDFLQSRPPPHCPPPDPCGLPPSPPPSLIPTNPLHDHRCQTEIRSHISLNLFAIPRPIPFRRRAGVFHGVRGGCCCWVVCCVWAGAGGRGVSVRRSPPPRPLRVAAGGTRWGGQSSDRDGVPDGWRPRLYTHRIFSCSVHMTNPNVAQTRPHKPLNLNRHAHPNRSITMDNAFAGGSTIAHHGIETLRV